MPEVPGSNGAKYITNAGWEDVPHLSEREKSDLEAITPLHLLPAVKHGIPVSSIGRIYPWDFSKIACDPQPLPASWPRVYGFDPAPNRTAAVWGALEEATDTLYLYGEYFGTHHVPRLHAQSIQLRGKWIPGMSDPAAEGKTIDGQKVIDIYRGLGLELHIADNAVTAGLQAVIDRVITGRLRAFSTLGGLRFEWNNYRRDKQQKIIKENDDRLDCLRYICLGGLRFARVKPAYVDWQSSRGQPSSTIADPIAGF